MKRNKRFIKTILCLALSTVMVFSDMGMTAAASENAVVEELPSENKEEEISNAEESVWEKETEEQASKQSETEEAVSEESITEKETSGENETEKADTEETLTENASTEETDAEETEGESSITEETVDGTAVEETEVEETAVEQKLVFAEDDIAHGEYKENGNDISWVIDADGKLIVEGTGNFADQDDHSDERAPWYKYRLQIKSAKINVQGATNASNMFLGCSKLVTVNVNDFDTSNVTDMSGMFRGCSSLTGLDLSKFDTRKVINMADMFGVVIYDYMSGGGYNGCGSLKILDISSFDTSNVTDMSGMFSGCSSLENLDISNFNTSNVVNMAEMFGCVVPLHAGDGCYSLKNLDLRNFDTSNVTDMNAMFNSCSSLENLDISSFETSNVRNMYRMFYGCESLKNLNVSHFNTGKVMNMEQMFAKCFELTSLDLGNFDTGNVVNMHYMFWSCYSLTDLNLSSFNTSKVENMHYMFSECVSLVRLDLSSFDTSNVRDIHSMFYDCESLKNLDISNFNTSKVENMYEMFADCRNLENLNISHFNTKNANNMYQMFANCGKLTSLDLSNFNLENTGCLEKMLYGCNALTEIHTPRNVPEAVDLPSGTWYDSNGNTYTELLQNFSYSILLAKGKKPTVSEERIAAVKAKTTYQIGDVIDISDLTVRYYGSDGTVKTLNPADYTTNVDDVSTSTLGDKTLMVIYRKENKTLTAEVKLTVRLDTKRIVNIFGIEIGNSVYNKKPISYTGTPSVRTADYIDVISEVTLRYIYTGTQADGTVYAATTEAPVNAGRYKLTVAVTQDNEKYKGYEEFPFSITKAPLTVTVHDMGLAIGAALPEKKDYKYDVTGLFEGDKLITDPAFTCGISSTATAGTYDIVASGASAGMNYEITYKNGTLTVSETGESAAYYTVTFNMSGHGSDITNTGIKEGSLIEKPQDPQAEGYIFTGWYKERGCTVLWDFATDTIQSDTVLYAGWTKKDEDGVNDKYDDTDDSQYTDGERADLSTAAAAISDIKAKTYDGNAYEPAVKVSIKANGKTTTLIEGTDYRVLYENNVAAGQKAKVTVKGNGIYKGSLSKEYTINPKPIKKLKIVAGGMSKTAAVSESSLSELPIHVYDGTKLLEYGTDYTLSSYTPSKSSAKVTVTGAGNYGAAATAKITLYSVDSSNIINPENVTLDTDTAVYTGKAIKSIEPTVEIGGTTLRKNKDYKVQYTNNTNAGTAFVIVTGKGAYKGKVVKTFTIKAVEVSASQITIKSIPAKTYNRKLQKPSVTVTVPNGNRTKKLVKNKDYTVSYRNNLHAGENTAVVIITGKGNYAGIRQEATFTINPQKITKASLKGTQGNLTLTYAGRALKEGSDYDAPKYGAVKKNKVEVTIVGKGDFTGTMKKNVKTKQ